MKFTIERQDGKLHYCTECHETIFNEFIFKNFTPELLKKNQVMMVLLRCSNCDKINMIFHNKIRNIKLLDSNTLEVV